jgi:signal peptidase I
MFGLFTSEQRRARHDAQNWLHLAQKIIHFRRDQLPPPELHAVHQAAHELRTRLRERADAARLKMAMEQLEACLRRSGGVYYPKSSLVDHLEFLLVAAILFLGIRAFFVQPFKIPTNSMWPSYYGMTHEIFRSKDEEPGAISRAFRFAAFGATGRRVDAPVEGEIKLLLARTENGGISLLQEEVPGRRWLVLPAKASRYTLLVGKTPVTVTLPPDFRFDKVLGESFFGRGAGFTHVLTKAASEGRWTSNFPVTYRGRQMMVPVIEIPTGVRVRAGERVVSFDILTGDQLFVDRVSYHFFRPAVGDGFVFRTGNIPGIGRDQYYIKRLVGTPGDTLEVKSPVLLRNGKPIEGAGAFGKNARREGLYPGYTNAWDLAVGKTVTVPERCFYAMGDNSPDSSDSRAWKFVPADDVVGRPLFIYYPFTRRWGPAP